MCFSILSMQCKIFLFFSSDNLVLFEFILSQLKFADQLRNGDMIFNRIFEVLAAAKPTAKRSIIQELNDIIDDIRHTDAAHKLMYFYIFFKNNYN